MTQVLHMWVIVTLLHSGSICEDSSYDACKLVVSNVSRLRTHRHMFGTIPLYLNSLGPQLTVSTEVNFKGEP